MTIKKEVTALDVFDAFLFLTQFCGIRDSLSEVEGAEEVSLSIAGSINVNYAALMEETRGILEDLCGCFFSSVGEVLDEEGSLNTTGIRVLLVGFDILKYSFSDSLNMMKDFVLISSDEDLEKGEMVAKVATFTKYLVSEGYIRISSSHSNEQLLNMLDTRAADVTKSVVMSMELQDAGKELLDPDMAIIRAKLNGPVIAVTSEEVVYDLASMEPPTKSVN